MGTLARNLGLLAVLALGLSGCGAGGDERPPSPVAEGAPVLAREQSADANATPWPFLAQITLNIHSKEAAAKGVLRSDVGKAVADSIRRSGAEYSLDAMSKWMVVANAGPPVRLEEVATVDVYLMRRDVAGVAATGAGWQNDARPARIDVDVMLGTVKASGVDLNDIAKAVRGLLPGKEYSLEDVRNLTVPGKNGTSVRLGQVAKITVVFQGDAAREAP